MGNNQREWEIKIVNVVIDGIENVCLSYLTIKLYQDQSARIQKKYDYCPLGGEGISAFCNCVFARPDLNAIFPICQLQDCEHFIKHLEDS